MVKVQLRHAWLDARRTLVGLDEDEYFWEPTSPCWSVRRRADGVHGWGRGDVVCEDVWPPPDRLPATTIAWRVVHLAAWTDVYASFAFGDATADINDADVPLGFEDGLAWMTRAQDAFSAAVDTLSAEGLFELRPAPWGARVSVVRLVSTMLTEHVHHIAEIGALRDLRRGHGANRPPAAVHPMPAWWTG